MRTKIVLFQSFPFLGLIFCISYFMISLLPLPLALLHMKGFFGKQCFSSLYLMVLRKWCFISFHVSVINSVYECACVCVCVWVESQVFMPLPWMSVPVTCFRAQSNMCCPKVAQLLCCTDIYTHVVGCGGTNQGMKQARNLCMNQGHEVR